MYHHGDPPEYEGFGNAFLKTVYYGKPVTCNRYSLYRTDIEAKGFKGVTTDGFVTNDTVVVTFDLPAPNPTLPNE